MNEAISVSDLGENSSRYEKLTAVETEHVLMQMWTGWAVLAYLGAFSAGSLLIAILLSKKTRNKPFNFYIMALTFPDFFFNLFCGVTCTVNTTASRYFSTGMCKFQGFYCVFGIGASLWIGAIIAYEIHKMLRFSKIRRRYHPPSVGLIIKQVATVNAICLAFGLLGLTGKSWIPFHYRAGGGGAACVPLEIDRASTIFFWSFFIPFYAGTPFVFVVFVACDTAARKLLPPKGRRRLLALYFLKILLCFSLSWLPFVVLVHIAGPYLNNAVWVLWVAGAVSHLQSVISVILAMMKPDIRRAVFRLWTFGACSEPDHPETEDTYDPFDVIGFLRWSSASFRSSISRSVLQLHSPPSDQDQQQRPTETLDCTETNVERFSSKCLPSGGSRRASVTFEQMHSEEMDVMGKDLEIESSIDEELPTTFVEGAPKPNIDLATDVEP